MPFLSGKNFIIKHLKMRKRDKDQKERGEGKREERKIVVTQSKK